MERNQMPIGFGMALAMNPEAMQYFSNLSEDKKKEIIEGTHKIQSRDEMHWYVSRLASDKNTAATVRLNG